MNAVYIPPAPPPAVLRADLDEKQRMVAALMLAYDRLSGTLIDGLAYETFASARQVAERIDTRVRHETSSESSRYPHLGQRLLVQRPAWARLDVHGLRICAEFEYDHGEEFFCLVRFVFDYRPGRPGVSYGPVEACYPDEPDEYDPVAALLVFYDPQRKCWVETVDVDWDWVVEACHVEEEEFYLAGREYY